MPADIHIPMPTLYSKNGCVQCNAILRFFDQHKIPFHLIKLEDAPEALDAVKEWGYLTVPVVYWNLEHFNGFRPDKLDEIKKAYAPAEEEAEAVAA